MAPAAVGVAQKEDDAQGLDAPDLFDGVVLFLAAITRGLLRRGLGADDAPFGPVMGKRGEAGAAAGMGAPGAGASSSGTTTGATSASEPPRGWARAVRARAGAAPRALSAASRAGQRTCSHGLAWPWPRPPKRPCPTWSAEVLRYPRINQSRAAGGRRGQFL